MPSRLSDVGQRVRLGGWVHRSRDLGGLAFVDLRDRAGIVQVSFDPSYCPADVCAAAAALGPETVVLVEGEVVARPEAMRNPELATGDVEVRATALQVVGPATPPAIPVARARNENLAAEELRLRHRFLDLRRPELQANIMLRHRLMQATRRYLSERGFFEIETPILTKPTPEGARDYLVPSRVHPGEFYALPQSPQLYKQLLMVSGFDRYFQIARCFRDEDLRQDRQPEFTQIDIEASFIAARRHHDARARGSIARAVARGRRAGARHDSAASPTPRRWSGSARDRPDTRYGLEIFDASDVFRGADFGITRTALEQGGRVRGIRVPGGARAVPQAGGRDRGGGEEGAARLDCCGSSWRTALSKDRSRSSSAEGAAARLELAARATSALFVAGTRPRVEPGAGSRAAGRRATDEHDSRERSASFLWVTDFPMFEKDAETGALGAVHHPFTSPMPDGHSRCSTRAPERARAQAYDCVFNGTELGGGSIRISDPRLAVARLRAARHRRGDGAGALRLSARGTARRRAAARRHRVRLRSDRDAARERGIAARRDRVSEDDRGARAVRGRAGARSGTEDLADLHISDRG